MIFLNKFKKANRNQTDEKCDYNVCRRRVSAFKLCENSKDVLASILEEGKRKALKDQELRLGNLPTEKALGIHQDIEE